MLSRYLPRLCLLLSALVLVSCSAKPAGNSSATAAATTVTISAAASTQEILATLGRDFSEQQHATVKLNTGPSSGLANQILEGAPADLFLSASPQWAERLQTAGLAETTVPLLTNKLVLIVPRGNPAQVFEPQDLLTERVHKIALAGEQVPAGKYADQALQKLELLQPLTADGKIARGQDVRGALSYVQRGEAEAGIVYATDARITPEVEVVYELDPALHEPIVYALVLLTHGAENPTARQYFDFLQSDTANAVYTAAGFERIALP